MVGICWNTSFLLGWPIFRGNLLVSGRVWPLFFWEIWILVCENALEKKVFPLNCGTYVNFHWKGSEPNWSCNYPLNMRDYWNLQASDSFQTTHNFEIRGSFFGVWLILNFGWFWKASSKLLVTVNIRTDTMALIFRRPWTTCGSTSLRLRILWSLRPQQQELLREVLPKPSSLMRIEAGGSGDSKDFLVSLQTNSYIKHLKTGSPQKMSQKWKELDI